LPSVKNVLLMSVYKRIFIVFILTAFAKTGKNQAVQNKNDTSIIHLADPTIFNYKKSFYLYGTVEGNSRNGFLVYESKDLKNWKLSGKNDGYALKKGDAFGTSGFWAPQVLWYKNKFFMAYVANENIAIAESDHPAGPFKQINKQALQAPVKQIDPFIFIDDDGKKYLYHVRLTGGNKIFVAEMNDSLSAIKEESLKECIIATDDWENTVKANWPVTEGPSVLKHRGLYYLFYTANDFRNPDYAVGYATSKNPLGPWIKYSGNPILTKASIKQNGPGHGDFFLNRNQLCYVFHTHNSDSAVAPRKTALVKAKFSGNKNNGADTLVIEKENFYFLRR
jgi:xylan 1,4-beta-xylosidase